MQVKSLAQQYTQVEDQLSRSVHYAAKTESDGVTTIEQASFNGADDLIKVAVERTRFIWTGSYGIFYPRRRPFR